VSGSRAIFTLDQAIDRLVVLYGSGGKIYDLELELQLTKAMVRDLMPDHVWHQWRKSPRRKMKSINDV